MKIISLITLALLINACGDVYVESPDMKGAEVPTVPTDDLDPADEPSVPEQEVVEASLVTLQADGSRKYTNNVYRFSMTLPASWGQLNEEVFDHPTIEEFIYQVRVSSKADPRQYVEVNVAPLALRDTAKVADYPHFLVASAQGRSFFIASGGDNAGKPGLEDEFYFDLYNESLRIERSFETF